MDGATLAGDPGVAISFSSLTSFQADGEHGAYKQVGLMRVIGLSAANVTYTMKAIYDYDIAATAPDPTSPTGSGSGALWDVAKWDQAVWDTTLNGESVIQGGQNIGRTIAIAMTGEATTRITVVGWDITVNSGGYL